MKKITSIFALLLCVFVFSCSNDDDKETSCRLLAQMSHLNLLEEPVYNKS